MSKRKLKEPEGVTPSVEWSFGQMYIYINFPTFPNIFHIFWRYGKHWEGAVVVEHTVFEVSDPLYFISYFLGLHRILQFYAIEILSGLYCFISLFFCCFSTIVWIFFKMVSHFILFFQNSILFFIQNLFWILVEKGGI